MKMHDALDRLREKRGVTVSEMARQLGFVSDTTLGRWLKGDTEPRVSEMLAIVEYFGVGLADVFGADMARRRLDAPASIYTDDDDFYLKLIGDSGLTREQVVKRLLGLSQEPAKNHSGRHQGT
jgi:transcriptional regulator with XRE-family HTH domain